MAWWISLEYVLGYMLDLFDTVDTTLKYWFLYQQEGYFRKTYGYVTYHTHTSLLYPKKP